MNSSALLFDLAQRSCEKILGAKLTEYAKNVVKDDGRGLEAGVMLQIEDSENKDMEIWGDIISELWHMRRGMRKFDPLISAEWVDVISDGANLTAHSRTSRVEFHVYWAGRREGFFT